MSSDKKITIRLPQEELDLLDTYCRTTSRSKTEVLRECIRGLKRKLKKVSNSASSIKN